MRRLLFTAALIGCVANGSIAADYATTVRATPGLLAYYRFEESDESIVDSSRHKRAAKIEGEALHGVDSAFDALGRALRLTGNGYLRIPALGDVDAFTIELWLNQAGAPSESIAAIYAADGWKPSFVHLNARKNDALELAVNGVSSFANSETSVVVPGRWVHLAATYDRNAGLQRLFVNGRIAHESSAKPQPKVRLPAAAIGAWINGQTTRPLAADVDEVAVYSTALTPGQLRNHYNLGKGDTHPTIDFAKEIRPLLERRCFECHGADAQESQLRLDVRDSVLRGGESGEPALSPFEADESHLVKLVTSSDPEHRMPPDGERLSADEVALLRNWIDQGAPWPDALAGRWEQEKVTTTHWSFQPLGSYEPPQIDDPFVANPIDAFILAKLREKNLAPSPPADPRTLVRRLYLDVHGLPPSAEQVVEFTRLFSPSPDLPLYRSGGEERESGRGREWEKEYRRMVDDALASPRYGERWASHWLDVIRYADTHGFEVNTPRPNAWPFRDYVIQSLNDDKPYDRFLMEQIAGDQLGTDAATGFLVAAPALLRGQVGKDEASKRQARADELHEVIVSVGSGAMGLTLGCARCHNHKFDPISQRDYYQLQAMFAGLQYGERPLEQRGDDASLPKNVFAGKFVEPEASFRLYRGDAMQRRERVSPDVPAVFGSIQLESTTADADRRLALAKWLVDVKNPLTARVIVNRVWQHHFGTGLVSTPSDFGAMGTRPTHPELLDWLAAEFMKGTPWSLKALHRLILTSNTYRQSNRPRSEALAVDANAQLLWRFPPRRLEMEPIRDSMLAVSGVLDLTMGGPGFMLFKPNANYVRVYDPKEEWGPEDWRRMVYAHRVRMAQDGVFGAFDCPDAGQPQPVRSRSTTGIQALNLLNSTFVSQQAELLAKRAEREAGSDLTKQIARVFLLAYGREPNDAEQAAARATAEEFGLRAVCRAVYNSNEFLFLP